MAESKAESRSESRAESTTEITAVGVVGAGTMGHGIAQVAASAGYRVRLYDVSTELAERGVEWIAHDLARGVEKGKVKPEEREAVLGRISTTHVLHELADCQLVIEAAPEDLRLKQTLFNQLSTHCAPTAILASNTSSLPLTEIAAAADHPERVVGMHFFNPVPRMKLLEVVRAYQTSQATLAAARQVGERMGKELVVVEDHPGFASTRLGIALGMEAIRMVEEGVAPPEDIDRAMELGYGHPMGPLKLTDLVGLDVRLAIAEYLHRELGTHTFRPPQLLKKMVRAGKLGRKSGEGFYKYES
jgi:3-hydroxybutyryl-CoA dehydrogenase